MPSPFPGMNPWLEQAGVWEDFHNLYLNHIRVHLSGIVEPRYVVKLETRLNVRSTNVVENGFLGRADVGVVRGSDSRLLLRAPAAVDTPTALLEIPDYEVIPENYLTITDRSRRRVVTVLGLLSPANKRAGEDRQVYLAKRRQLFRSMTNLVEIDLLRGGLRTDAPVLPACAVAVVVIRSETFRRALTWTLSLRERLPRIPIPLEDPDPDAVLDLQAMLHETYDRGRLANDLYTFPPDVPLEPADAAWANDILTRDQALRG
jgi:hypothetical protein